MIPVVLFVDPQLEELKHWCDQPLGREDGLRGSRS
jgi:hypothetical protein